MATVFSTTGKALTSGLVGKIGTLAPIQAGWGTGAGTAAVGDTTLFTEANTTNGATGTRVAGTPTQVTTTLTNDTLQVVATITAGAAVTVTNAGLFDNTTIGSGNVFIKGDFTSIGVASGDSIQFTYQIKYA